MASNSEVRALKDLRAHASEARFVAQQMRDPKSRLIMLEIGRCYDLLAQHAERRAWFLRRDVCAPARERLKPRPGAGGD
jgi:hypothetical protein